MKALIDQIKKFHEASVFVVGDIMLDVFVYGDTERISPEAPIPILKINSRKEMLGGAGNVVRNLHALGCRVFFAGLTGSDASGAKIKSLLSAFENLNYRLETSEEPTIVKTRFISNSQQVLRTDIEMKFELSEMIEMRIIDYLARQIQQLDVVVISDYNKGTISSSLAAKIIAICRTHDVPVFVDPKGKNYGKYKNATLIKPNRKELIDCFNTDCIDGSEEIYAIKLRKLIQADYALVTLGKDGMILSEESNVLKIDSLNRAVYDVSGAGDTVIATLAAAYGSGASMTDAAKLANLSAGIVVSKPETAVITPEELLNEIRVSSKIYSQSSLIDIVEYWKRNNYTVGFTNGCFDLIHSGHISTLKFCKQKCDRLIVGLNSDRSVKRLKGSTRPINDENQRALVLSEFSSVDAVAIFDEDTPESLIHLIKPDVLIKGGDYCEEDVVGSSFIKSYGGRVLISPYIDGFSSTKILNRIESLSYEK